MATISDVVVALKNKKRIRHENWYDGQWILWDDHKRHLLLNPERLLSEKWEVEADPEPPKKKSK